MSIGKLTQVGRCGRPVVSVVGRSAGRVALRRRLPQGMAASSVPSQPGAPSPKSKGRFFEGVTRQLMAISKREGPTSSSGQWAARFAAALSQYAAAQNVLQAMPKPAQDDDAGTLAYKVAHRQAQARLDVLLRIKERAPADLIAKLGDLPGGDRDAVDGIPTIGAWPSMGRALTLSRMMLANAPVIPAASAPSVQSAQPLSHLRQLLGLISQTRLNVPDVTRWSIDIHDALANYDVAEESLQRLGHGLGGLHVLNALACCERLLAEETSLPYHPSTFTSPNGSFEGSQLWLAAAGAYLRTQKNESSQSERVRHYLGLRLRELKELAAPYDASIT